MKGESIGRGRELCIERKKGRKRGTETKGSESGGKRGEDREYNA